MNWQHPALFRKFGFWRPVVKFAFGACDVTVLYNSRKVLAVLRDEKAGQLAYETTCYQNIA